MYSACDLKSILDETTALLEGLKEANEDEKDEIQIRIKSNIRAIQLIGSEISDEETRSRAKEIVASFAEGIKMNLERNSVRKRKNIPQSDKDAIDTEILEGAKDLRRMAEKFNKTLEMDSKIVKDVTGRMQKGSKDSKTNLKHLTETSEGIKTSTIFIISILIFIITYFFVRFV